MSLAALAWGCGARSGLLVPEQVSGSGGAAGQGGAASIGGNLASAGSLALGGAAGLGGSSVAGGPPGFSGSGGAALGGTGGHSGGVSGAAGFAGTSGAAGNSSNAHCGDGTVEAPEQCDDGNVANGDGCSVSCLVEPRAVNSGNFFACALGANGVVKCWGYNMDHGELGLGDTLERGGQPNQMGGNLPAVNLGVGRSVRALSVGSYGPTSCAVLDDSSVKCWGDNGDGELGLGDTVDRGVEPDQMGDNLPVVQLGTGRTARALGCGRFWSCALLDNDSVKCWGDNEDGQLGLGDSQERGYTSGTMGDALPAVDLGAGRTAQAISTGQFSACALLDHGAVKCWGDNEDGELGLGDAVARGSRSNQMGDNLPAVDLGTGRIATAISVGGDSACALLDDGAVKCWGYNATGQLGLGDKQARGDQPGEMGDQLPTVNLGTGRSARAISTSGLTTCAVLDNGTLKCWGFNLTGAVGLGDTTNRGDQPNEMGDDLPTVDLGAGRTAQAVSVGYQATCALLDNGTVKCWGANGSGELGLGDTANRGDKPAEMGDALPAVDLVF